ncbi:hypothetical protein Ddye_029617 [Dipteronia dyeriana]|uniref:RNase H type-1 domain-containing protein n=1 Tax=Dipteronia dyeriana TaxID=168575 RepID=A0AAD9TG13_9ROSI|nr:hypothetical protein Ddye_029617 [Dipteronia dyeriana]
MVGHSWWPPDVGKIKVNTDATTDSIAGKIGNGIVIKNHAGDVLAASSQPFRYGLAYEVAEELAIFRGLVFAQESGLMPCEVESDAPAVVNLIHTDNPPLSDIGTIICDIVHFLDCHPQCLVGFAPRSTNRAAHSLAKFGLTLGDDCFWMEEAWVSPIILVDRPGNL